MKTKIKEEFNKMTKNEKIYAGTIVPLWLSITIYMMIGIPVYLP